MSMTYREYIGYLSSFMKRVTDLIIGIPRDTTVFSMDGNTRGMQFYPGVPMSMFPLATTPAEATALKNGTAPFLETTTILYWTKSGSTWSSVPYIGQHPFLRKYCLVMGSNNGKLFLHGEPGTLYQVDTTSPTQ